jgi:uncharacterized OsmC-like protein
MSEAEKIKTAFERQTKAVTLREGVGKGTATTTARVRRGLTVDVEDGPFRFVVDTNPKWGGNNEGPNPGVYGRGALASCLAQGYVMWAARLDVPLDDVVVEVHADYDTRGMCAVGNVGPAYRQVRVKVSLASPAPDADIERVLRAAEEHSPYFEIFKDSLDVRREGHTNKARQ